MTEQTRPGRAAMTLAFSKTGERATSMRPMSSLAGTLPSSTASSPAVCARSHRSHAADIHQGIETVDAVQTLSSFRAYLMAIARNLLVLAPAPPLGLQLQIEPIGDVAPRADHFAEPSRGAAAGSLRRRLCAAPAPPRSQIVLELHYWEGLTLREVADVFAVPEGTVKSRIHRAISLLRGHVDALMLEQRSATSASAADLDAWSANLRRLFGHADTPA